jgi:hypothetical protein
MAYGQQPTEARKPKRNVAVLFERMVGIWTCYSHRVKEHSRALVERDSVLAEIALGLP